MHDATRTGKGPVPRAQRRPSRGRIVVGYLGVALLGALIAALASYGLRRLGF